ncbi:hypothetical protein MJ561_01515 [Klebsiella pneumoniae]|nr:hypothetical protein MJ561_01515 [Klebsiella pneumoniae]
MNNDWHVKALLTFSTASLEMTRCRYQPNDSDVPSLLVSTITPLCCGVKNRLR